MMKITYAGESFLTSDDVADALLLFVAALGEAHEAESLRIPSMRTDGTTSYVRLVVGPASELIAVPEDSTFPEPNADEFISGLRTRTRALASPLPITDSESNWGDSLAWDDFDTL